MHRRSLLLLITPAALAQPTPALPASVVHFRIDTPELEPEQVQQAVLMPVEGVLLRLPGLTRTHSTSTHRHCRGELAFEREAGEAERTLVAATLARHPALRARVWQVWLAPPHGLRVN